MRIVNKAPFRNTQKVFKNNLNKFRPNLVAYKISPRAEPIGKGKNLHSKGLNFEVFGTKFLISCIEILQQVSALLVTYGQRCFYSFGPWSDPGNLRGSSLGLATECDELERKNDRSRKSRVPYDPAGTDPIKHFWDVQPVWPDLVKFRQFGKILLVFGNFWQFI